MQHYIEIWGRDKVPYSYNWTQEMFIVRIPIESSTHYQLFTHSGCTPKLFPYNALRAKQGGGLYHFYDGLWYDQAGARTNNLPHKRRTP